MDLSNLDKKTIDQIVTGANTRYANNRNYTRSILLNEDSGCVMEEYKRMYNNNRDTDTVKNSYTNTEKAVAILGTLIATTSIAFAVKYLLNRQTGGSGCEPNSKVGSEIFGGDTSVLQYMKDNADSIVLDRSIVNNILKTNPNNTMLQSVGIGDNIYNLTLAQALQTENEPLIILYIIQEMYKHKLSHQNYWSSIKIIIYSVVIITILILFIILLNYFTFELKSNQKINQPTDQPTDQPPDQIPYL
jgi:hypothetical protein